MTDDVRPLSIELGDMLAKARLGYEVALGLRDPPPEDPAIVAARERRAAEQEARDRAAAEHADRVQNDAEYRASMFPVPGSAPSPPPGSEAAALARSTAERETNAVLARSGPTPASIEAERRRVR